MIAARNFILRARRPKRACAPPLLLEQRVPLFPGIIGGSARFAHQIHMSGRLKIITVVGLVLVAHPFGLVFPALVVNRGIEKPAIPATMQVRIALGAHVAFQNFLCGNQLDRVPALEAGKYNIRHGQILTRSSAIGSSFPPANDSASRTGDGVLSPVRSLRRWADPACFGTRHRLP